MSEQVHIVFRVGCLNLALVSSAVRRILPLPRLETPPLSPPALAGFLDLGGRPVVVLRAAALLEVEAPPPGLYAHLLLLATDEPETALLVDRVTGLRQGGAAALAAPETESLRGVVEGELALDTGTAHLLSLDRLLDRHERQRLAAFAHAEAARRLALEQPL